MIEHDIVTSVLIQAHTCNLPKDELIDEINKAFDAAKQNCYDSILKKRIKPSVIATGKLIRNEQEQDND